MLTLNTIKLKKLNNLIRTKSYCYISLNFNLPSFIVKKDISAKVCSHMASPALSHI